jgi:hypothetical protein
LDGLSNSAALLAILLAKVSPPAKMDGVNGLPGAGWVR